MAKEKNELDYDIDPEIYDDPEEGVGDEKKYDGEAVDFIEYDHAQFELPDDFEPGEDAPVEDGNRTATETDFNGLPRHLRKWGLSVQEADGWRFRGRPYSFRPRAVICHHTASGARSGNWASMNTVTYGRPDLPGPLCQFLLARDGTVRIISGNYANHAGYGGPRGGVPANMGNTYAWGIEAENNGIGEKWTDKQLNAYYRLCAALLDLMDTKDTNKVFGHKEWTSRKIDPAGINMPSFRYRVKQALQAGPSVVRIDVSAVRPGKTNVHIKRAKARLKAKGYFHGENDTGYFGKGLRDAFTKFQKAQGWKGEDADGIPGPTTLRRLGFEPY